MTTEADGIYIDSMFQLERLYLNAECKSHLERLYKSVKISYNILYYKFKSRKKYT